MTAPAVRVIAPSAVAGALMPLSFSPFHLWWLAPCSLAVLFFCWRGASPKHAFWSGFAFGFTEFLFGIYWIYISVHLIGNAPIWIGLLLTIGLVAVLALFPAIVGWLAARWFGTQGWWHWLLTMPALWVLLDWTRGWILSGFGWLAPGYSQTESWLVGLAPVLGVHGVSWAVLLISGALVTIVAGGGRARFVALAVPFVVAGLGFGLERVAWTTLKDELMTVALVQGAVPQELKWLPEQLDDTQALYRDLTLESLGSQLIVWPEAAIPELYENVRTYLRGIEASTAQSGSHVMLGMLRYHVPTGTYQNALFTLGQPDSVYVKRHLVPYGEYFPVPGFMRDWLRSMNLPNIDTVPGEPGQPPIELLGEKLAVTICYEDVFGAEQLHSFPEATLLINVSNDAWFGDSIAAPQHLQIARMRAAEVRRYQLRSTNTGITAVIDPYGRVVSQLPQFEPAVLKATVSGVTGSTPYIVWGNFAVVIACGLAVAAGYLLAPRSV